MTDKKKNLEQLLQLDEIYLVEWSFGPSPKDMIAEARKVRDMAMASTIISMGLRWLIEPVLCQYQTDVILMPYLNENKLPTIHKKENYGDSIATRTHGQRPIEKFSLPNRCIFVTENLDILKTNSLVKLWQEAAKNTMKKLGPDWQKYWNENAVGRKQWQDLFCPMWVAIKLNGAEFKKNSKNYLKQIQELMARRKNTRNFHYWSGDNGLKCTVCHKREAIADEEHWQNIKKENTRFARRFKAEGEILCSICLVKRVAETGDLNSDLKIKVRFEAITDICCSLVRQRLDTLRMSINGDLGRAIAELDLGIKQFNGEYPADLLYPHILTEKGFRREYDKSPQNWTNQNARNAAKQVKDALAKVHLHKAPEYYVILRLDADEMGKWMSGEFFDDTFDLECQRKLSKTLVFLADVIYPFLVEEIWGGTVIFSSGDELLTLGPMFFEVTGENEKVLSALHIANLLRQGFHHGATIVNSFLKEHKLNNLYKTFQQRCKDYEDTHGIDFAVNEKSDKEATVSCGLSVAHHQAILKHVLKEAYLAEDFAKKQVDRNALACSLQVRSGSPVLLGSKWTIGEKDFYQCFEILLNALAHTNKQYRYSSRWLYDLMDVINRVMVDFHSEQEIIVAGDEPTTLALLKSEAARLLERHRCKDKKYHEQMREQILEAMNIVLEARISLRPKIFAQDNRAVESWLRLLAFWVRSYRAIFAEKVPSIDQEKV